MVLQKTFKDLNSKMLVVHCVGQVLNLFVSDFINKVKSMKNTFGTGKEICNIVKKSHQRDIKLDEMRKVSKNSYKGKHAFCPTNRAVRGQTLISFVNNHNQLMDR